MSQPQPNEIRRGRTIHERVARECRLKPALQVCAGAPASAGPFAEPARLLRAVCASLPGILLFVALTGCDAGGADQTATAGATEQATFDVERKRDWAAKLRAEGLDEQALRVYEQLLDEGRGLSPNAFVGASLIVAEIHVAKGRHEEALASLIRASAFEPEGEVGRKIDRLRIECLERLGKTAAADRLLDRAVRPGGASSEADDVVLARIGEETISRAEFEALLAQQPREAAERMKDPAARAEILKSLVAQRVMERKARKLGLESDPKVRLAVDLAAREILVRKMVADEMRGGVEIEPDDVRLYYQAHAARFREPSRFQLAQILADDLDHEARIRKALETESFEDVARRESRDAGTAATGGLLEGEVLIGRSHPLLGDTRRLAQVLGDTPPGEVAAEALKTTKGRHVLKVVGRRDGAPISFDDAREQAERMLRAEREQLLLQEMMQKALEESDVELFEDRLDG